MLPSVGTALNDKPILRCNQNKTYEPRKQDISDPFPVYLGPHWPLMSWTQKEQRNNGRAESRTIRRETKKIQIKHAKTCKKERAATG